MASLQAKPIFAVSSPRSGSTLFRLILDAHPRIAVPPPAWLYDFLWPYLYSYGDLSAPSNLEALAQDMIDAPTLQRWPALPTVAELVERAAEPSYRGLYDALHVWYADQAGKQRWGEKSPRNAHWMDEIRADFPGAQFIHLIRDGRDVAMDLADTSLFPETLYAGAGVWKSWVSSIRDSAQRLPQEQYLEVKYEEFCADPEARLKKVCAFIGEEFSPQMLHHDQSDSSKHWGGSDALHAQTSRPISTDYCGIYRVLSEADRAVIEHFIGGLLEELGYARSTAPVAPPPHLARQLLGSDTVTLLKNAEYKPELRKRRQQRLEKGVWDEKDRPTQLWSTM